MMCKMVLSKEWCAVMFISNPWPSCDAVKNAVSSGSKPHLDSLTASIKQDKELEGDIIRWVFRPLQGQITHMSSWNKLTFA